jgi:protein SCO1/2
MFNIKSFCIIVILYLAIIGIDTNSEAENSNSLPPIAREIGIDQKLDQQIPADLQFKDESGDNVSLDKYFNSNKPLVLTLVYYECPMLCTEVLNGLLKALNVMHLQVGNDFDIVTVSFDAGETPHLASAKKAAYVKAYKHDGANKGWHFLTGSQASIDKLTKATGFRYAYDPKSDLFAHGAAIMVLTPQGKISHYFFGVEFSARDLRLALVEASKGKIGSVTDQILLFCFHYDPSQGKYSAYALNFVRLGGIITIICLGIFIVKHRKK